MGDGVVFPLREESSPERLDLLNERGKWMDDSEDGDGDGDDNAGYTHVENIDETADAERAIVRTPDVVTLN